MADIQLDQNWRLMLTTPELRLVLKALGGRLQGSQEYEEARHLGDRLTVMRATLTKDMNRHADRLLLHGAAAKEGADDVDAG
jgi:hypothetical protein